MIDALSKRKTILILFIEGFVSVSLQMLMMRQLVPFVGNSVVISSLVIGVFLASLSLGYVYGGRYNGDYIKKIIKNIIVSGIFLSVGLSYTGMSYSFVFLSHLSFLPLLNVSIYLILFLAPIVFMLGQTVPLLTNFYKSKKTSEVVGDSFAINTVGSVLGSVITAVFFFDFFGMAKTIFIDALLLGVVLSLLLDKKSILKYASIYSIVLIACFHLNVNKEKEYFQLTNAYNNYQVSHYDGGAFFIMNNSYSSVIFNKNKSNSKNWKYMNKTKEILFSKRNLNLQNKDILILGAGGFTLSEGNNIPDNNFVYVDIDPDIKDVAEEFFLEENINGTFKAEDARTFIKKSEDKYDAILIDLYSNKTSIPWHLLTDEFVKEVNRVTKDEGTVIFNVIANGNFKTEYSRKVYNTIKKNFPYCNVTPEDSGTNKTNILYVCKKILEDQQSIYIDDRSESVIDEF